MPPLILAFASPSRRSIPQHAERQHQAGNRARLGPRAERCYEEITYEGYGPGGVAVLVEAATDNRNRTASEVRSLFTKAGGSLASSGAVAWQFEARGIIECSGDFAKVGEAAIEAGADDVDEEAGSVFVYTDPAALERVRTNLEGAGVSVKSAEASIVQSQRSTLTPTMHERT